MDAMFKLSGECEFMIAEKTMVAVCGTAMAVLAKMGDKPKEPAKTETAK